MILLVSVVLNFPLLFSDALEGGSSNLGSITNKWYGPSYQPSWWNSEVVVGLRAGEFEYEGSNNNASFRSGAFEGSMIGLSIGVVMGSIRAVTLNGLPHSEDETPCKTLISHILGGLLSGALIGLVYVFFKECLFR